MLHVILGTATWKIRNAEKLVIGYVALMRKERAVVKIIRIRIYYVVYRFVRADGGGVTILKHLTKLKPKKIHQIS